MRQVYYISAVAADPDYAAKRQVREAFSRSHDVEFFYPLDRHGAFSVAAALRDLTASQLVIADLSFERPSCYFEVGLAQAIGAPVVLIAAVGTRLHQAGGTERVLLYEDFASYRRAVDQAISNLSSTDDLARERGLGQVEPCGDVDVDNPTRES